MLSGAGSHDYPASIHLLINNALTMGQTMDVRFFFAIIDSRA
jgi:hypothetical protein